MIENVSLRTHSKAVGEIYRFRGSREWVGRRGYGKKITVVTTKVFTIRKYRRSYQNMEANVDHPVRPDAGDKWWLRLIRESTAQDG